MAVKSDNNALLIEALTEVTDAARVTDNETIRSEHSTDESYHTAHLPDVVVFPETVREVQEILQPNRPRGMTSTVYL